ncbi:MAG: squalene synthase HpnC [Ignavibacteria bacterium]
MQADFDIAYRYCKEVALGHYENFPVGSLLIPKNKRKYIYSVYAFARTADDIADSVNFSQYEKLKKLNDFEDELTKIEHDQLTNLIPETKNIFIALYNTMIELGISTENFRDLLIAFKQDAEELSYETFDKILEYSYYSANPVGRLVLSVFGYDIERDKIIFEKSDKICTALQLTNFWQDVSRDLKMKRIYIPSEIMKDYEYSEKLLLNETENDNFREMLKHLVSRTYEIFDEGRDIIKMLSGRLKLEIKATIAGGEMILNKIESINYNVLSSRVQINNCEKVKLLGKAFF